jgi:hypothetical protein
MPVQIIENWSDVRGVVRSCYPSPDVGGFIAVEVVVARVLPVEGFANLLAHKEGESLEVLIPEELIKFLGIVQGVTIACRVRRAGRDRVFVHRNHLSAHASG